MPDILDLLQELMVPGESFMLQQRVPVTDGYGDDIGDIEEKWIDVRELYGSIDNPAEDPETKRGHEEITPKYKGYFHCNFDIPTNKLGEFRIKHVVPVSKDSTENRYYGIKGLDRNLSLDNAPVYVGLMLEYSQKWRDD